MNDRLQVTHAPDEVVVSVDGTDLVRYVYRPETAPAESPKPYIHPLRTLAGDVVSVYRPHDHRWHRGLQMTASHLSGENFWGGGTYVHREGGYVQLDNNGSVLHESFDRLDAAGGRLDLVERLAWISSGGERWLDELREITVHRVDPAAGSWELGWTTTLTGRRGEPLRFGSPTTHGRPMAGYSGLFWRGPRSFTGGQVLGPGDRGGEAMMGTRAAWLAFVGLHDEVDRASTLVFTGPADHHWFVRSGEFAAVNPSWAFHREFELAPGETRTWRYRVVVATGAWDRDAVEGYLKEHPW
ncbi:PmoA family protein [Streptosporangium fragile]|uniref:PmoA family protein n=1 Tax=Streptosporangium fragile TaxID=46186 RepID=A0ABP6I8E2_9ACTN